MSSSAFWDHGVHCLHCNSSRHLCEPVLPGNPYHSTHIVCQAFSPALQLLLIPRLHRLISSIPMIPPTIHVIFIRFMSFLAHLSLLSLAPPVTLQPLLCVLQPHHIILDVPTVQRTEFLYYQNPNAIAMIEYIHAATTMI